MGLIVIRKDLIKMQICALDRRYVYQTFKTTKLKTVARYLLSSVIAVCQFEVEFSFFNASKVEKPLHEQ